MFGTVVCLRWRLRPGGVPGDNVTLTEFPHWRAASALSTLRLAVKSPQSPARPRQKAARVCALMTSPLCAVLTCARSMRNSRVVEHGRHMGHCIRRVGADASPARWRTRRSSALPSAGSWSTSRGRRGGGGNRRGGVGRRRASGVRCALGRVLIAIRHGTLVVSCILRGPRQRSNNSRTRIGRLAEATTTKTTPSRRAAVLPWPGHLRLRLRIALAKFLNAAACAAAARSYSSTSPAAGAEASALCDRRTSSSNCGTSMGPPSKFVAPRS